MSYTVRALKDLISSHKPSIVGLSETKLNSRRWDSLRVVVGFQNCFSVDCEGRSGGLALLWHKDVDVSVCSFSKSHIDVIVKGDSVFRLTLFYGNPRVERRKESWELLRKLKRERSEPWVALGDFNEITYSWEMRGVRKRRSSQMREFREALEDCALSDLRWKGNPFTFSNKRKGPNETRARLDRAVANSEWMAEFPNAKVLNGFANSSDHNPIILYLKEPKQHHRSIGGREFKFEPMWLRDKDFVQIVAEAWRGVGQRAHRWSEKLKSCGERLALWNKESFGNVQKKLKYLKKEINKLREGPRSEEVARKEAALSNELDEWLAREESLWKQRGRSDWLKAGGKKLYSSNQKHHNGRRGRELTSL